MGALAPYWRRTGPAEDLRQILQRQRREGLLRPEEKTYGHPRHRPMTAMERKTLRPKLAELGLSDVSSTQSVERTGWVSSTYDSESAPLRQP
jgi:hypothetical protein